MEPFTTSIIAMYPNPVSGTASVEYATVENASVQLVLCDPLGRTVKTIVNTVQKPGVYIVQFSLGDLPEGVYFLTMREGEFRGLKELLLLK